LGQNASRSSPQQVQDREIKDLIEDDEHWRMATWTEYPWAKLSIVHVNGSPIRIPRVVGTMFNNSEHCDLVMNLGSSSGHGAPLSVTTRI
jgi:hypothetical protein